jgi:hypothetical protein
MNVYNANTCGRSVVVQGRQYSAGLEAASDDIGRSNSTILNIPMVSILDSWP